MPSYVQPELARGSSPHTRGALCDTMTNRLKWRIIPAYAGSTAYMCGAYSRLQGSSPHTRGAQRRNTPTFSYRRDHPRIRGEHSMITVESGNNGGIIPAYAGSTQQRQFAIRGDQGSSPHTRGAHLTTCATIPHSSILDSVIRVHSRTSTQPQPRCYPPNLLAARYLLALLHPVCGIPSIVASSVPNGLFINSTPSQSAGCQSG